MPAHTDNVVQHLLPWPSWEEVTLMQLQLEGMTERTAESLEPNQHSQELSIGGGGGGYKAANTNVNNYWPESTHSVYPGLGGDVLQFKPMIDIGTNDLTFTIEIGEGGEYETLVVAGPHFDGELKVSGKTLWDGVRGELEIDSVELIKP